MAPMPKVPDELIVLVARAVVDAGCYKASTGHSCVVTVQVGGRGWAAQVRDRKLYVAWLDDAWRFTLSAAVYCLVALVVDATPLDLDHDLSPAQRDVLERATLTRDRTDAALFFASGGRTLNPRKSA